MNGQPGFQENQYGFLAGAESRLERNTFGLAAGYTHADLSEARTESSGTRDTLRLAAYAGREMGPVDLAATVGYGLHFLSQKRPFANAGTARGDHIGQEFTAAAQASAPMALGGLVMTPRVGLRYAYYHANGFDESGAGEQSLRVGADTARSLQPFVGVSFDKAFGDTRRPVNLQFRVAYAHELLDTDRAVTVASQDGTQFTAPGTNLPRNFVTLGASVGVALAKRFDVSLAYDALVNTGGVVAGGKCQGELSVLTGPRRGHRPERSPGAWARRRGRPPLQRSSAALASRYSACNRLTSSCTDSNSCVAPTP